MKTYLVTLTEEAVFEFIVEAENEDAAFDNADQVFCQLENRDKFLSYVANREINTVQESKQ